MRRRTALGSLLATPALATASWAPAWPESPVRFIIPFPPGGSNDTLARILPPRLQEILGRPIVEDNRPGALGSVASTEAARAQPDGHTWILANDMLANNDTLMSLPCRVMEAFTFCSLLRTRSYA